MGDTNEIENLEQLLKEENIIQYDPICVRKKANISKSYSEYKFDSLQFSKEKLLNDIATVSPKLDALLKNIEKLDQRDKEKDGVLYKHFIFSDLKSSSSGAKLLASALIAKGFTLGYTAPVIKRHVIEKEKKEEKENEENKEENKEENEEENKKEKKKEKTYGKIVLASSEELEKNKNNNMYLLASIGVYDQHINIDTKRNILTIFNQRPENIHGELVRFIIMDSGYKEGIDLFDIKYIHLFEPSILSSDQKQVIGRGTRTCGQKGLDFHPTRGWPLDVFVYDLEIPEVLRPAFINTKSMIELYLKAMNLDIRLFHFAADLEKISVLGSVDYELNKNVHMFSIHNRPIDNEYVYGGVKKLATKNKNVTEIMDGVLIRKPMENNMGFSEMRDYIREHFSQYEWNPVEMENKCTNELKGGSGDIITYSPTQDFIRHYFTPESPLKGMLLWQSVGTGKTCTAIATATSTFEKEGYTILWVTRTTLKNDIWKNMFDQVCNEDIRDKIINTGLVIPSENKKRMKLVSKSWRVRPMSYKQFSNLVSKENAFYKSLVKINGEEDPLRKTLIIIDEAHKLYGGADLSSLERPDTVALHKSLMNSYQISGTDSVKLLLMTATPITKDPIELIQLLNLCKPMEMQMPATFEEFSEKYLNEMGKFTDKGKADYLDEIAGYISYLNREKDARQFAQPILHNINVPIVKDMQNLDKFDKKYVRQYLDSDMVELKHQIEDSIKNTNNEFAEVDATTFNGLQKKCGPIENPKTKKVCQQIVRENIRQLINEIKEEQMKVKEYTKELREQLKNKNLFKGEAMANITDNIEKYEDDYDKFKTSAYYTIRNECGKTIKSVSGLRNKMVEHPKIMEYDKLLERVNHRIGELKDNLVVTVENNKKRMKYLQRILKEDLREIERNVIKLVIKEEKKTRSDLLKVQQKDTIKSIEILQKKVNKTKKKREHVYKNLRKILRRTITEKKREEKAMQKAEQKTRKALRAQEEYEEEMTHSFLKKKNEEYSSKIDQELQNALLNHSEEEKAKELKRTEKLKEKELKKTEKLKEKELKKTEKLKEKELKRTEKLKEKELKKINRTMKNKK